MARKLLLLAVLVLLPGGLIALVGAWVAQRLARTERGRRVLHRAIVRVKRFPRLAKRLASAVPASVRMSVLNSRGPTPQLS